MKGLFSKILYAMVLLFCINSAQAIVRHALDCQFDASIYYPHAKTMDVIECDAGLEQCRADIGPLPCSDKRCIWKINLGKCVDGWKHCMTALPSPMTPKELEDAELYSLEKCCLDNGCGS